MTTLKLSVEKKLELGEAHIHLLPYKEALSSEPDYFLDHLSPEEREELDSIGLESRRCEFLVSRGWVRLVLSQYLGTEGRDIKFIREGFGKPRLRDHDLHFNLSHADQWMACTVSRHRVGVDIEKIGTGIRARDQRDLLTRRFFSLKEQDYLNSQPEEDRGMVFTRIFTLKEAYGKALGRGLGFSLKQLAVPLPLPEKGRVEEWEFFSTVLEPWGFCLAHFMEGPDPGSGRYTLFNWDQGLPEDAWSQARPGETPGKIFQPLTQKGFHVHIDR